MNRRLHTSGASRRDPSDRAMSVQAPSAERQRDPASPMLTDEADFDASMRLPLAIMTVPFQRADHAKVYSPAKALPAGTVYPELELPFLGCGR